MTVPAVQTFQSAGVNLDPSVQPKLPVMAWMTQFQAGDVTETALPWMLAQGWQIQSIDYDRNTTPPTPYYNMNRQGMVNAAVLQSLVNTYTDAYNEGRFLNAARYDNIVANWVSLIGTTIGDVDAMATNSNAYVTAYLSSLDSLMTQVDNLIGPATTDALTQYQNILGQLTAYQGRLGEFEANYSDYATKLNALISTEGAAAAAFDPAYAAALAQLQTDYNALLAAVQALEATASTNLTNHVAAFTTQLGFLATDYTTHNYITVAYLNNLGVAERARIDEAWNTALANDLQALTSRGFASSQQVTSITDRNTTLRNRDLTDLADRLNRELLENQHRCYEQLVAERRSTMEGLERVQLLRDALSRWQVQVDLELERELDQARLKIAEGIDRRHTVAQEINRILGEQQNQILGQHQAAAKDELAGRGTAISQGIGAGEFAVSARARLAAMQMEANFKRLQGQTDTHDREQQLFRYMIDTTNNIVVGLFGFQERRTDSYPSLEVLANLTSQLGDSGSTSWVSP